MTALGVILFGEDNAQQLAGLRLVIGVRPAFRSFLVKHCAHLAHSGFLGKLKPAVVLWIAAQHFRPAAITYAIFVDGIRHL